MTENLLQNDQALLDEEEVELPANFKPMEEAPLRDCDLYLQSIVQEAVFSAEAGKNDEVSIYNTIYQKFEAKSIEDVERVLNLIRKNQRILNQTL